MPRQADPEDQLLRLVGPADEAERVADTLPGGILGPVSHCDSPARRLGHELAVPEQPKVVGACPLPLPVPGASDDGNADADQVGGDAARLDDQASLAVPDDGLGPVQAR